ncbi:NAD(P)-binding protein [Xylaria nigripes]|nr:NAD(P)-binding protein [Xylaria nigripes]
MSANMVLIAVDASNIGIGLEAAKALYESQKAYNVIIGSRTVSKGQDAVMELRQKYPQTVSTLSVAQVDLESDESLENAVLGIPSSYKYGRLDVLLNNGRADFDNEMQAGRKSTRESFNASWNVVVTSTHTYLDDTSSAATAQVMGALDPSIGGHFLKDVVEGKRDHDEGKAIRKDMIQP